MLGARRAHGLSLRPRRAPGLALTTSRIPLGRASLLASSIIRDAARVGLPAPSLTVAGGVRRFAPEVGEVTLVAAFAPGHQKDVLDRFAALPAAVKVLGRSPSRVQLETPKGLLTVHVADPDDAGSALVWHTGSPDHVAALAERAAARGLQFADGKLRQNGQPVAARTESALYAALGLTVIPPELREGGGEIAAAEAGQLPGLITAEHMRGDLHMHTTWSDGRDSLERMAGAARALGYEYIAITDHSERAWSSRKLSLADVPLQRDELEGVRKAIPGVVILHGVEVDIMRDGSLDFDDSILGGFDIVLASLHDHGGQSGRDLTDRYLAAIRHPLVNVITHPANRSPALSNGYDIDFDRIFAAAAASGTAVEVDGAPGHLDLDGALARRAVAAGATVTIDSDCHRADALARQMQFGVGTARRGWVEPRHVLNTRSIDEVRAFIAAKRAGR